MSTDIKIVSIHDMDPRGFLEFDTLQVVQAIAPNVKGYSWIARTFECTGTPIPVDSIMSFDQFVQQLGEVEQTIDAELFGFDEADRGSTGTRALTDLLQLPRTPARVAILAVDGAYFEVISKDARVIDLLRHVFRDVRDRDPSLYFTPDISSAAS